MLRLWIKISAVLAGFAASTANAAPQAIDAHNWGLGLQEAASPVAEHINDFHNLLLYIITAITIFVLLLLVFVVIRFREKRNPKPSRTVHNTLLEIIWTAVPVAILVVIAFPSFDLLYFTDKSQDAEMTVKVYGNTWNWTFEYPDHGNFSFTSTMVPAEDLKEGQPRNLAADPIAVIPSGTKVRFIVTSNDTLHSFAMPSWGVKIDAVPGRLNETWTTVPAKYEGSIFYGQCSELCGTGHAFMPIAIEVVSPADFEAWVAKAQEEYGEAQPPSDSGPSVPRLAGQQTGDTR